MKVEFSKYRALYKEHLLNYEPALLDNGRFQARVAVTALRSSQTVAQRFFDLEVFDTEAEAADRGRQEGMAWIDSQSAATSAGHT